MQAGLQHEAAADQSLFEYICQLITKVAAARECAWEDS